MVVGGSGVGRGVVLSTLGPGRLSSTNTHHLQEGGCWGKAKEERKKKKESRAVQRERERVRQREAESDWERGGGGREWEARWCHICTKPIPETAVTWLLSPGALSASWLAWSERTTVKYTHILHKLSQKIKSDVTKIFSLRFEIIFSFDKINCASVMWFYFELFFLWNFCSCSKVSMNSWLQTVLVVLLKYIYIYY